MSSPTANEAMVWEAVRATLAFLPLDKIMGQASNTSINHLKQQVSKIMAAVKMTSWGDRHGHLTLVLSDAKYQAVTGVPLAMTVRIAEPPIVPEALANNTTLTSRPHVMADHNLACQEFWMQEAVNTVIVGRTHFNCFYIIQIKVVQKRLGALPKLVLILCRVRLRL